MSHATPGAGAAAYAGALARFYDGYFTGLDGEVEFYRQQALEAGGPVLEGGCGTGRTLFPVAAAGVDITGVELAPEMLARARAHAEGLPEEVRRRVRLVSGDLRDLPDVGTGFRLASLPYRTFQHLFTPAEQVACLTGLRERLAAGGRLVLNQFDPTADLAQLLTESSPPDDPARWPVDTEFEIPDGSARVRARFRRGYDLAAQVLQQQFRFEVLDDAGRVGDTEDGQLLLRYTYRFEMEHLLARCGFRVLSLAGGFGGEPYPGYGEQVWVCQREG